MRQSNKRKPGFKHSVWGMVILLAVILLSYGGVTAARYVQRQTSNMVAEAENFYFSSDLLRDKEEKASYYIDPATTEIKLHLYNWVDAERVTLTDISYKIMVDGGSVKTDSSSGRLSGSPDIPIQNSAEIIVSPDPVGSGAVPAQIEVTVTTKPYNKELKATFIRALGNQYMIEEGPEDSFRTAAILTMICTDGEKDIKLKLPPTVIPDATDDRVTRGENTYIFHSPGYGVYSLVLLKKNTAININRTATDFADEITVTETTAAVGLNGGV